VVGIQRKLKDEPPTIAQPCPGLVDAIEAKNGDTRVKSLIQIYCDAFLKTAKGKSVDKIILRCTHYPIVENRFKDYLANNSNILSQPKIISKALETYIKDHPELNLATGDPSKVFSIGKRFESL